MNGTKFEKTNDKWQITGWDTICERHNDSDPCPSMSQ